MGVRKGVQERFKEDDGLAKAGIEIIVDGVEEFPIAWRVKRVPAGESLYGGGKGGIQFLDQIGEDRVFVKEL